MSCICFVIGIFVVVLIDHRWTFLFFYAQNAQNTVICETDYNRTNFLLEMTVAYVLRFMIKNQQNMV